MHAMPLRWVIWLTFGLISSALMFSAAEGSTISVDMESISYLDRDGVELATVGPPPVICDIIDWQFVCNEEASSFHGHWSYWNGDGSFELILESHYDGLETNYIDLGTYLLDDTEGLIQMRAGDTLHGSSGGSLAAITHGVAVSSIQAVSTPEPAAGTLMLCLLPCLLMWRARR